MKPIAVAVAIALIAASSALAAPRHSRVDRAKHSDAKAMIVDSNSHDVYAGGRLIGRDPDPNIRQSLRDNYFTRRGQ